MEAWWVCARQSGGNARSCGDKAKTGFVTLLNKECKEAACRKSPQATTARQVSIAAARKPRCVDADVR